RRRAVTASTFAIGPSSFSIVRVSMQVSPGPPCPTPRHLISYPHNRGVTAAACCPDAACFRHRMIPRRAGRILSSRFPVSLENTDLETVSLSTSPQFLAIIERSPRRQDEASELTPSHR